MKRIDKIAYYLEKHKYGILATLVLHLALFLYLQIATYEETVLYEPWDFRAMNEEAPDDIEITAEQIETETEESLLEQEEISSFVKNLDDSREKSKDNNQFFTSYSDHKDAKSIEDRYEQEIKDRIQREREEKNKMNSSLETEQKKEEKKEVKEFEFGKKASDKAVGGATMVSYTLKDRRPLNDNDWYIRNPGYTCGDVNGIVKVAVSVDVGGKVITANFVEEGSQNVTECMRKKAIEYALMSRFNYSEKSPQRQEGVITYRFVYRN